MAAHWLRHSRPLIWSALALLMGGVLISRYAADTAPAATDTITVGTNVGYPPFIFVNDAGTVTGFDIAVMEAIATRLGKKLIIKDMAFDVLLLALRHGIVDIIIGGISLTKSRKETGLLIPYYTDHAEALGCFYRAEKPYTDTSLATAAAQHLTVCTQAGSVYEDVLQAYPGIVIKTVPDMSDVTLEVAYGAADLGVLCIDATHALLQIQPLFAGHELCVPDEHAGHGLGLGIAPQNTQLKQAITQALAALQADGTLDRLAAQWLSKEPV